MRLLRYFLLLASAGLIVLCSWAAVEAVRWSKWDIWSFWAAVTYLVLNIIYIWFSSPSIGPKLAGVGQSPGRIRRLFSLWLDAKEAELRRRTLGGDGS
jgi:hypothetical protein